MHNNPIKFDDPTGHEAGSAYEIPPVIVVIVALVVFTFLREEPDRRHEAIGENCQGTLAECFNEGATKNFSNNQTINVQEFNEMLNAIDTDLERKWRTPYDSSRAGYDTPFFNGASMFNKGEVEDDIVCINNKCSPQSAVNYVAQGMYSAYTGQSLEDSLNLTNNWNKWTHGHKATDDEKYWTEYGYNYYKSKNAQNNKKIARVQLIAQ